MPRTSLASTTAGVRYDGPGDRDPRQRRFLPLRDARSALRRRLPHPQMPPERCARRTRARQAYPASTRHPRSLVAERRRWLGVPEALVGGPDNDADRGGTHLRTGGRPIAASRPAAGDAVSGDPHPARSSRSPVRDCGGARAVLRRARPGSTRRCGVGRSPGRSSASDGISAAAPRGGTCGAAGIAVSGNEKGRDGL
jgi:hypothetical protein